MVILLLTLFAAILIHLATIAVVGRSLGVNIRLFSLGFGPAIFEKRTLRLGAIPAGGYVRFRNSQWETIPPEEMSTALDGRSIFEQIVISLSGCIALLVLGVGMAGAAGLDAFLNTPRQIFAGATSPFGDAQILIQQGWDFVRQAPFSILAGIVCTKVSALNLLPFPPLNGGAAIAVIARRIGIAKWWHPSATMLLAIVYFTLFVSWCLALMWFTVGSR